METKAREDMMMVVVAAMAKYARSAGWGERPNARRAATFLSGRRKRLRAHGRREHHSNMVRGVGCDAEAQEGRGAEADHE
eukprot:2778590-Pleurochrysis_carterae.AAC.1